jgi:succinoglycan biosynthesis protein ExoO
MNKQFNQSPRVSAVMPVYNGARTLMEAVNSVLNQTYGDFELIICNDASTDETENILNNIKDGRVTVIHNRQNLGVGPTRDNAIDLARGVWIAVIDADDAWAPERLEVMLKEADACCDEMIFDDLIECHDTPLGMVPWHEMRGKRAFGSNGIDAVEVPITEFVREKRLLIKPIFPAKYVKKYKISHGFSRFAEDTEFFLKLLAYGLGIRYVPRAMYYYRITPESLSSLANRFILMKKILENSLSYFEHAPDIQTAIRKKISETVRSEYYMSFILAKKRKEVFKALRILYLYPWIIPEYFCSKIKTLRYDIHRLRHGGRPKRIL